MFSGYSMSSSTSRHPELGAMNNVDSQRVAIAYNTGALVEREYPAIARRAIAEGRGAPYSPIPDDYFE